MRRYKEGYERRREEALARAPEGVARLLLLTPLPPKEEVAHLHEDDQYLVRRYSAMVTPVFGATQADIDEGCLDAMHRVGPGGEIDVEVIR